MSDFVDYDSLIDTVHKDITDRNGKPKELPIPCLPQLDDMLWGIPKGELTVMGGRPSMGKTAVVLNFMLDWLIMRKNVMFFSWDDSKESVIRRLISLYGMIDNNLLKKGKFGNLESDTKAINGLKNILIKEHFYISDKRGRTVNDFERLVNMPKKVDVVVVDYLQLADTKGYAQERLAFNEFLLKAKQVARERNCGMVILSQMTRDSASLDKNGRVRPPMMHELKGTGSCEQDASVVILLHWDWFYHKDDTLTPPWEYKLRVEKNKQGETGSVTCFYYGKYYKISATPMLNEHTVYTPNKE